MKARGRLSELFLKCLTRKESSDFSSCGLGALIPSTEFGSRDMRSGLEHREMPRKRAMRLQDLSQFVGLIYDTALDPDAWLTMLNPEAEAR